MAGQRSPDPAPVIRRPTTDVLYSLEVIAWHILKSCNKNWTVLNVVP